MRHLILVVGISLALLCAGCGDDDDSAPPRGPELIVFESPGLRPEGIEYDARRRRFLVSSSTQGTVHAVSDAGELTLVVADSGMSSLLGIEVDELRDQLVAAGSLASGAPAVGFYDLGSGDTLRVVDLGEIALSADPLANDVTVDSAGVAYVTDTNSAAVYRVDTDDTASVLLADEVLMFVNGIEIIDDAEVLVNTFGRAQALFRIPVADPGSFELVQADVNILGDGMVFLPDGDLVVVSVVGDVLRLRSDDGWRSAQLVATWASSVITDSAPTTAAVRGDDAYVVFAHLFDAERREYEIERVDFGFAE